MNAEVDDAVMIQRCRDGDTAAFGSLVVKYQDSVFNVVYRILGNHADAADAAQEVFLKAFRSIATFKGSATFRTWLYAIAVNTCISCRRKNQMQRKQHHVTFATGGNDDCGGAAGEQQPDWPGPDEDAMQREQIERLEEAIRQLPDDMRMLVVLKDIEGCDYTECAAATGMPLGTVKSRLFRARQKLREMLE